MKSYALLTTVLCLLVAAPAKAEEKGSGFAASLGCAAVRPDIVSPRVGAEATNEYIPILNITYNFNPYLSLGTAAGITRHEFTTSNGTLLGKASMAPFHLVAQYHVLPEWVIDPYFGAGIHHTIFFKQGGPAFDHLENFKASTHAVFNAGLNFNINDKYFVNLDAKKFLIETEVKYKGAAQKVEDIYLDPMLISLGFGMRF